jgi:putative oxidoreductase
MKDVIDLIGRIFLSIIFLFEAYDSIVYFGDTKNTMTDYGLVWQQDLLLVGAIISLIIGGVFLLIGYRTTLASIMLLLYFVPVTLIVYSFWNDPVEIQRIQSIIFMKNIAIIGGLLMMTVKDPGKYSIRRIFRAARISHREWSPDD